jgi:hypothetical protein
LKSKRVERKVKGGFVWKVEAGHWAEWKFFAFEKLFLARGYQP